MRVAKFTDYYRPYKSEAKDARLRGVWFGGGADIKKRAWDYYFFVDLEGHKQEPRIQKALQGLESKCKFLKILGSYPVGE